MFIKSKLFFLKNKNLIIISTFITSTISFIVCIAFYSMTEEPYAFKRLLFVAAITFTFLIWIVWFFLKKFLSQAVINTIIENWKVVVIFTFGLLPFLYSGWNSQALDIFIKPISRYEGQITPSDDSSGGICIREVKNTWGILPYKNTFRDYIGADCTYPGWAFSTDPLCLANDI